MYSISSAPALAGYSSTAELVLVGLQNWSARNHDLYQCRRDLRVAAHYRHLAAALRTKAVADRRLARAKAAPRRKRAAVSVGPNRPLFFWGINFTFS